MCESDNSSYKTNFKKSEASQLYNACYLLSLVAQPASLVRSSGPCDPDNGRMLAVLPTPNPLQEPHHI